MVSQVWGRIVSNIGVRLLRLPLLLTVLGVEDFGRWLVLTSLSSWLSIPNTGTASFAAGSMAMSAGAGDLHAARRTYSDLVFFHSILFAILSCFAWLTSSLIPLHLWLGIPAGRALECVRALQLMSLGVLVAGMSETFGARLKASGRSHILAFWLGGVAWLELLLLMAVLRYTERFDIMAATLPICSFILMVGLYVSSRRSLRQVRFDRSCVTWEGQFRLFRKGLYYQAFPLGNAILLQGQVLVVQWLLGPASVAVFSTARTLVRVISQGLEIVNHSVWPEMSLLFGSRNMGRIAVLHRSSVMFSLGLSIVSVSLFFVSGPSLYALASGNTLMADRPLLSCFLVAVPLNALWYTSSMVQLACNRHEGIAKRYLASTLIALAAAILLTRSMGIFGAALATAVSDLLMIPYVLRRSIRITEDAFKGIMERAFKDMINLSGRFVP